MNENFLSTGSGERGKQTKVLCLGSRLATCRIKRDAASCRHERAGDEERNYLLKVRFVSSKRIIFTCSASTNGTTSFGLFRGKVYDFYFYMSLKSHVRHQSEMHNFDRADY